MDVLKIIASTLNDQEIRLLEEQYISDNSTKCTTFLKIVISKDHFTDEQAQELLYKGKDSVGYARLKSKI